MVRIDYSKNNYCTTCCIKYEKGVIFCKVKGCGRRLRIKGINHSQKYEVPRIA